MLLRFYGTKGYVKARSRSHAGHSAFTVEAAGFRLLCDFGENRKGRLEAVGPDAIFVSHGHPDHAWGLAEGTKVPRIVKEHVARVEAGIDTFDVGRITEFILPRGSEGLVRLHWARTVARRAERRVVSLSRRDPLNPDLLRYMNRLSSLLYQMAVWCQKRERGKTEHPSYRK